MELDILVGWQGLPKSLREHSKKLGLVLNFIRKEGSIEKGRAHFEQGGVATLDEALLPKRLLSRLLFQSHTHADNQLFKSIFQKDA